MNSCQSERTSDSKTDTPKTASEGSDVVLNAKKIKIFNLNKSDFDKTASNNENHNLVEKFCNQSKGYQSKEWEGMNDCSWAIEKYLLEKNQNLLRAGNELILSFSNGTKQNLLHKEETQQYFQYDGFWEKGNLYVVKEINKGACQKTHLFNKDTGKAREFEGNFWYNAEGANGLIDHCGELLTVIALRDQNEIEQLLTEKLVNFQILDLMWTSDMEVVAKVQQENESATYKKLLFQ